MDQAKAEMLEPLDSFETERLTSHRLRQEHFDFIHSMHQNKNVMVNLGGLRSAQQTKEYFKGNISHWEENGYGIWILQGKTVHQFIGRGGLKNVTLENANEVQVAYGLMPEFWGRGLATEFTAELTKIAFNKLGLKTVISLIEPKNTASIKVVEKNGFKYERETTSNGRPHLLYRKNVIKA